MKRVLSVRDDSTAKTLIGPLQDLGYEWDILRDQTGAIVPNNATLDTILNALRATKVPDVLVVPFLHVKTVSGEKLHGLQVLSTLLGTQLSYHSVPIFLLVSIAAEFYFQGAINEIHRRDDQSFLKVFDANVHVLRESIHIPTEKHTSGIAMNQGDYQNRLQGLRMELVAHLQRFGHVFEAV